MVPQFHLVQEQQDIMEVVVVEQLLLEQMHRALHQEQEVQEHQTQY
jgi:hypothetical protein